MPDDENYTEDKRQSADNNLFKMYIKNGNFMKKQATPLNKCCFKFLCFDFIFINNTFILHLFLMLVECTGLL